jgi:hypothetical protein
LILLIDRLQSRKTNVITPGVLESFIKTGDSSQSVYLNAELLDAIREHGISDLTDAITREAIQYFFADTGGKTRECMLLLVTGYDCCAFKWHA